MNKEFALILLLGVVCVCMGDRCSSFRTHRKCQAKQFQFASSNHGYGSDNFGYGSHHGNTQSCDKSFRVFVSTEIRPEEDGVTNRPEDFLDIFECEIGRSRGGTLRNIKGALNLFKNKFGVDVTGIKLREFRKAGKNGVKRFNGAVRVNLYVLSQSATGNSRYHGEIGDCFSRSFHMEKTSDAGISISFVKDFTSSKGQFYPAGSLLTYGDVWIPSCQILIHYESDILSGLVSGENRKESFIGDRFLIFTEYDDLGWGLQTALLIRKNGIETARYYSTWNDENRGRKNRRHFRKRDGRGGKRNRRY